MTRSAERCLLLVAGLLAGLMTASLWPSRRENPSPPPDTIPASPGIPRVVEAAPTEPAHPPPSVPAPVSPEPQPPPGDAAQAETARRERQLGVGLARALLGFMMYAQEHEGRFPEALDDLPLRYFKGNPPVIVDPLSQQPLALEYTAGLTTNDSSRTVVLATAPLHDGRRWIVLLDGSVHVVTESEYEARVAGLPALDENGR